MKAYGQAQTPQSHMDTPYCRILHWFEPYPLFPLQVFCGALASACLGALHAVSGSSGEYDRIGAWRSKTRRKAVETKCKWTCHSRGTSVINKYCDAVLFRNHKGCAQYMRCTVQHSTRLAVGCWTCSRPLLVLADTAKTVRCTCPPI